MDIKETFIKLTSETYPHGTEKELFSKLPQDLSEDEFGNLYIQIGENTSCLFTSHLDTASYDKVKVNHIIDEQFIQTDGTSILGADDKAGVTIMLYMIENNVPGLYYFFLGEERGCIGSKKVAQKWKDNPLQKIKKVISFDRRGTDSIITHQSSLRCCSEEFAEQLSDELNRESNKLFSEGFDYKSDPTGIYTDSYQFINIYPECTNISVGYYSEHTKSEKQDIVHLERLAKTCIGIDWEGLTVKRDTNETEVERNDFWEQPYNKKSKPGNSIRKWFIDKDFDDFISLLEFDTNGNIIKYDVSPKRKVMEKRTIEGFIFDLDLDIVKVEWDGIDCVCKHSPINGVPGGVTELTRKDLIPYLPILNDWKKQTN